MNKKLYNIIGVMFNMLSIIYIGLWAYVCWDIFSGLNTPIRLAFNIFVALSFILTILFLGFLSIIMHNRYFFKNKKEDR